MAIEAFYREAPRSTISTPPQEAALVGVDYLPKSIIADVVINPAARDLLPNNLKYLASPNFIARNVLISVPQDATDHNILEPYAFGRALPLGYGLIPFGDTIGSTVTSKGCWLGGQQIFDTKIGRKNIGNHPGLLSEEGAHDDTIVSNALLANGFRSSLHLGYAILRVTEFKFWLYKKWGNQTGYPNTITESFAELIEDKQDPAYLIRVGGSLDRIHDTIKRQQQLERLRSETARVARMFLIEGGIQGTQIHRLISRSGNEKFNQIIREILEKLADRRLINTNEFRIYCTLMMSIFSENAQAFVKANSVIKHPLSGFYTSASKDVDLAYFTYDYDSAIGDYEGESPEEIYGDYINTAQKTMRDYTELFSQILIPSNLQPWRPAPLTLKKATKSQISRYAESSENEEPRRKLHRYHIT